MEKSSELTPRTVMEDLAPGAETQELDPKEADTATGGALMLGRAALVGATLTPDDDDDDVRLP